MTVTVSTSGPNGRLKKQTMLVHRMVMLAFTADEQPPGYDTVGHANRIRDDNCLTNLRWATPEQQNANCDMVFKTEVRSSHGVVLSMQMQTLSYAITHTRFASCMLSTTLWLECTSVLSTMSRLAFCCSGVAQRRLVRRPRMRFALIHRVTPRRLLVGLEGKHDHPVHEHSLLLQAAVGTACRDGHRYVSVLVFVLRQYPAICVPHSSKGQRRVRNVQGGARRPALLLRLLLWLLLRLLLLLRMVQKSSKHPVLHVTGRSPPQLPNMHMRFNLALISFGDTLQEITCGYPSAGTIRYLDPFGGSSRVPWQRALRPAPLQPGAVQPAPPQPPPWQPPAPSPTPAPAWSARHSSTRTPHVAGASPPQVTNMHARSTRDASE